MRKNKEINQKAHINIKFEKFNIQKIIPIFILVYVFYYFKKWNIKKILIEVDLSIIKSQGGGPVQLQRGISKILPYETQYCKFFPVDSINITNLTKNIDYFYISYPNINEKSYNECLFKNKANTLILGPSFVPNNWFHFPDLKYWKERKFKEILREIKAVAVQSIRVRDHIALKSNSKDLLKKFIISRSCTYIIPNEIKIFKERSIDIILYLKYADSNREKEGLQLFNLLKNTNKKIHILKYGYFKKNDLIYLASNSKFIIYFSFYDCGPIALKEIQNYGVIIFSHQKEFIISDKTGYYIPELENKNLTYAFNKIMKIINDLSKKNPDTRNIAQINQDINKCENTLDDLCNGIVNSYK